MAKPPAKPDSAPPGAASERLVGLPPLVTPATRLLILGSFPGAASLAARQYYAHPQNQFWRVLQAILPAGPHQLDMSSYENRSNWMLYHGVGLWDVYASCTRTGSLDAHIRDAVVNDFAALRQRCPQLAAIAHNGAESHRHSPVVVAALTEPGSPPGAPALPAYRLPSTSPANAAWSFERKLATWREVFERHGLV